MKKILLFLFTLFPAIAWAYRDRPASDGSYFSPITSFFLVVFGIVIAIVILRILFEFSKRVDWEGLFKGCFTIICVGGLLWGFVLLFFGRSCSSDQEKNIQSKSNIQDNSHTRCSNCNGTGIKEVLEINPNLYDSNGNIRPNQPTGRYVKVQCKVCNGKGYID